MIFLSEHYLAIKTLHILTAVLSIVLFFWRFLLHMYRQEQLGNRWLRVLPHANDTLLLTFAILLCFAIGQAPLTTPWLTAKVAAVILYIVAGTFALKRAKSRPAKWIWFIIALVLFSATVNIAVNKTPLIF